MVQTLKKTTPPPLSDGCLQACIVMWSAWWYWSTSDIIIIINDSIYPAVSKASRTGNKVSCQPNDCPNRCVFSSDLKLKWFCICACVNIVLFMMLWIMASTLTHIILLTVHDCVCVWSRIHISLIVTTTVSNIDQLRHIMSHFTEISLRLKQCRTVHTGYCRQ